ncbi:MAG: cytochrome c biogenesis protein CcdA [Candidatus Omnitrophota bacterium]
MNLSGSPLDFLWAFFGGVLVSFTPCVYPLLPITVAYIGASSANSKLKGFGLSLIYVSGISVTYTILGLAAVLTGSIFGRFSGLPLVRVIIGLIIIFFGFALWAGWGLGLSGRKPLMLKQRGTYLSCFILGITSGLITASCTVPVLGSILAFVAAKRNFIYGGFLLFSFAYGMGLLLILIGTFSSFLTSLPKSGRWMEIMKKICAVVLIITGIYFLVSGIIFLTLPGFSLNLPLRGGIAYAQDTRVSVPAIDFSLNSLSGKQIMLSGFKDKKAVILMFWTVGCKTCRAELPRLNQIYPDFIRGNIELLAINAGEHREMVAWYLRMNPVLFPILLDLDGRVSYSYALDGVPLFILINKSGKVVFYNHYFPYDDYKRILSE